MYLQWICMACWYVFWNVCVCLSPLAMTIHNMFFVMIKIWCVICVYLQYFMCGDQNLMGDICMFLYLQYYLCMVIKIWCTFMIVVMFVVLVSFVWLCIYNNCVWHLDMYFGMCLKFHLAMLSISMCLYLMHFQDF